MSIYYKYAPDWNKKTVSSYVDYCVFCYTSGSLVKWFSVNLVNRFRLKFLGYAHWFMSVRISHMKDHSISVYQARYATSVVAKYLDTSTVNTSEKIYNTTLSYYMIFTKDGGTEYRIVCGTIVLYD